MSILSLNKESLFPRQLWMTGREQHIMSISSLDKESLSRRRREVPEGLSPTKLVGGGGSTYKLCGN
jgi:hypothetical protein